jgi:hypothetical protein
VKTLLLCDHKWRDLPNLCAIKLVLESLGDKALISATKDAFAHAMAFKPDVVVFNHLHSERYRMFSRILKENGRGVVVLPTEGTMRPEFESICAGEFSDYSDVDIFLAWNNKAADDVRRRWSNSGTEALAIGCTRFDFHHPRFEEAVTTREASCATWGLDPSRPIVTWATAYAYAYLNGTAPKSRMVQFEREAVEIGLKECLRRIGIDLTDLPAIFSDGRGVAAEAFFEAAKALPDIQFVIKPHPLEDLGYYQRRLADAGLRNVRFCPQDYIWNILRASDVHLHRQCTTAVEAWMWGRPTIEMGMDKHPARTWPEREAGSDVAEDAKSLIELVRYRVATPIDSTLQEYRSNYIHTWFGAADGHRCEAAAKAIHQCALERQTTSPRQRIRGLGISYRDAAKAVLRRWLNRAATEPMTGRNRLEGIGAEDKWIRRGDITDYERMLRTKVPV